jgi:hypothetical protein
LKKIFVIILALYFVSFSFSQKNVKQKSNSGEKIDLLKYINMENVKADEEFLASDELEGRELGERGNDIAALYIKTEFEKAGLKPINNSYYQKFKVLRISPPKNAYLILNPAKGESIIAEFKKDFYPMSSGITAPEVSGEVVFAGYGITSPENNYDDYKDIDVKGKIVIVLTNSPQENDFSSPFGGKNAAKYRNNHIIKQKNAFAHGASAVLFMMEKAYRNMSIYIRSFGPFLDKPIYRLNKEILDSLPIPLSYITKDFANKMLQGTNQTIDKIIMKIDSALIPISFKIPNLKIAYKPDTKREFIDAQNVLGLLEGNDPKLKDEVVVLSGHYDHIGMSNDGKVFNGADDNASGITALLNIARAYQQLQFKPKRSILFLAATGEEKGLFGSEYYSENPLIPLQKTYLDLNMDMIGRLDDKYEENKDSNYIYIIGPKIMGGDLFRLNEEANKESYNLNFDYTYDDKKDPNIFYLRSDHINFAKHHIPVIAYFSGEHKDYHKVTDKVDKINFKLMIKRIALIGYTGWKFANYNYPINIERSIP